ncbi:MAG: DUF1826 domain-containing protein [Planctomycetia bacterium]
MGFLFSSQTTTVTARSTPKDAGSVEAAAAESSARFVDQPADLAEIYDDRFSLVVWNRPVDARLREFLVRYVLPRDFEKRRRFTAAEIIGGKSEAALRSLAPGADGGTDDRRFQAELQLLLEMYVELFDVEAVGLRVGVVTDDMCSRFHCDRVTVRLLCTFVGPGTDWVDDRDVDRRFLGHRAGDFDDETSGLLRPGAVVHRLPEYAVGLFKGTLWPGFAERGAVHRSPKVSHDGARRLFASIDGVE